MKNVCECKRAYINPLSGICTLCWNEEYPDDIDEVKEEDLLEFNLGVPKQETTADYIDRHIVEAMVEVAKQKIYSEEEVKQIIEATLIEYSDFVLADVPHWFEQFKKK